MEYSGYGQTVTHFNKASAKIVSKKFGTSCMEDVIEHRLLLAKEKLATTTLPIYKIAEQCGYSNVEHFSRQFKGKFTTSPKAYRESVKKN
ncbi:MAG: helix-turn-helix domain-containing protein [Clostridium sp.]